MARIFIDLREEERGWDGDVGLEIRDGNSLDKTDSCLCMGDTEVILSIRQMITLHELLDEWMNGALPTEIGAVKIRMMEAIKSVLDEGGTSTARALRMHDTGALSERIADAFKRKGLLPRLRRVE